MQRGFFKKLGYSIASGMLCCGICTIFTGNVRFWAILVSLGIFFLTFSILGTSIPFFPFGIGTCSLLFGIFILFTKQIPLWAILFYSGIFLFIALSKNLTVWIILVLIGFGINMFMSPEPVLQVLALGLTALLMRIFLLCYLKTTDSSSKK